MKIKITSIIILFAIWLVFNGCNNHPSDKNIGNSDSLKTLHLDSVYQAIAKDSVLKVLKLIEDSLAANKKEAKIKQSSFLKPSNIKFASQSESYMLAIEWEWNSVNTPMKVECLGYIINGGKSTIFRMNASGHECVVNAIKAYRAGNLELSISWLCAGQCQNINAREEIKKAGQMSAQFALQMFGGNVPE